LKIYRFIPAIASVFLLISLYACSSINNNEETLPTESETSSIENQTTSSELGEFNLSLNYVKQSGSASNQFAVWIEDMSGNLIKTLYATRFTANGGYKNRPDSIPTWVEKSNLNSMSKTEVDAITGATPKTGILSYTWDLTDNNDNAVSPGEYKFFVEGSMRWKNRVLYSGVINIGDNPATIQGDAEFIYQGSNNQPALSDSSTETSMISAVTANFIPASK